LKEEEEDLDLLSLEDDTEKKDSAEENKEDSLELKKSESDESKEEKRESF